MKLSPYNFANISSELEEWRDTLTTIINNGKFQYPTITTAPTWTGNKGEAVFVMPNSGGTTYYFMRNTAWVSWSSVTV